MIHTQGTKETARPPKELKSRELKGQNGEDPTLGSATPVRLTADGSPVNLSVAPIPSALGNLGRGPNEPSNVAAICRCLLKSFSAAFFTAAAAGP